MISAKPKAIGLLIFPGFQLLDAAGPIAAFEIAGRCAGGVYSLTVLAICGGPVASSAGVTMTAANAAEAPALDTLLVAGGDGVRAAAIDPDTIGFIRHAAGAARRVASVCTGAYILAEAGLLDGRRATTHWSSSAHFARRYPKIRLEPDRIFIQDGAVWTSAGIAAGIDLSLALIAEDLGEAIALQTSRQMVVYRQRPGGQSQFSAFLQIERPLGRFGALLGWMRDNLGIPLNVEVLAARAAMSPRNFARRFTQETSMTPARAVERMRVEAAREMVEAGTDLMDQIARRTGFGDVERMRCAFLRAFGQPPQGLRRAARVAAGSQ